MTYTKKNHTILQTLKRIHARRAAWARVQPISKIVAQFRQAAV